ncbi:DUF502 domain-containing protein [Ectothiorhodospiraceae bacterium 2226]|nr:DUF502 domain-containing protein [Ectothiorhodospiraceae bacterium 2226]
MRRGHFWGHFLAGALALLPLLAVLAAARYIERLAAGTWLAAQPFYVPGLGILLAVLGTYLFGLLLSTVVGRWVWDALERRLARMPTLGLMYRTVQQVLHQQPQGEGLFKRVVWVRSEGREELGFVTAEATDDGRLWVFLPAAPNPTAGRLLALAPHCVAPASLSVAEGVRHVVSLGSAVR